MAWLHKKNSILQSPLQGTFDLNVIYSRDALGKKKKKNTKISQALIGVGRGRAPNKILKQSLLHQESLWLTLIRNSEKVKPQETELISLVPPLLVLCLPLCLPLLLSPTAFWSLCLFPSTPAACPKRGVRRAPNRSKSPPGHTQNISNKNWLEHNLILQKATPLNAKSKLV